MSRAFNVLSERSVKSDIHFDDAVRACNITSSFGSSSLETMRGVDSVGVGIAWSSEGVEGMAMKAGVIDLGLAGESLRGSEGELMMKFASVLS